MIKDRLSRQRKLTTASLRTAFGCPPGEAGRRLSARQDAGEPQAEMPALLWLRQRLRQNSSNELAQTYIGPGMPKLIEFGQSSHPLGLRILMLRIVAGQRYRAGVRIDNLVEHLVDVFQSGFTFRALCLIAVTFAVVL